MNSILRKIKDQLKTTKDPVVRERLLMVKAAHEKSLRDAARIFGCTHGRVDFWKKRYGLSGLKGLRTKQKSGRPKKISLEQEKKIKRKVRKHNIKQGWRTQHVKSIIYEETGVKYCSRQVIRISQSWGLAQITPRTRYAYSKKDDREEFIKKTNHS